MTISLYETDFYAWTEAQVHLLKTQQWDGLDTVNLIEEVETLGRKERQELRNRLAVLIGHLLKWQFQPAQQSNSWLGTIREQRLQLKLLLQDSPSLKPYLEQALSDAYDLGVALAIRETELNEHVFPADCPFSLGQILELRFLPESE
jgi:hypothetical protein